MKKNTYLTVSKSIVLSFDPSGKLSVTGSISRKSFLIGPDVVKLLSYFTKFSSVEDAYSAISKVHEVERSQFNSSIEALMRQNVLVACDAKGKVADSVALAKSGFAFVEHHHTMLRDYPRVMSYRSAIMAKAKGKVVVEIGAGSGILSIFAAQAGAKKVIAIEESGISSLTQEMIDANKCGDIIELRTGNSKDLDIGEPADLIIHEILGVDPFAENIIPYISDARARFLKPKVGELLPHFLEVCCVGVFCPDGPRYNKARVLNEVREFEGLYGVDFSAFMARMQQRTYFDRRSAPDSERYFGLEVMTKECKLFDIDLTKDLTKIERTKKTKLDVIKPGRLNGVVLYFRAHLDDRIQVSTSPFAPKTHWEWNLRDLSETVAVKSGDRVSLKSERILNPLSGMEHLQINLG